MIKTISSYWIELLFFSKFKMMSLSYKILTYGSSFTFKKKLKSGFGISNLALGEYWNHDPKSHI